MPVEKVKIWCGFKKENNFERKGGGNAGAGYGGRTDAGDVLSGGTKH